MIKFYIKRTNLKTENNYLREITASALFGSKSILYPHSYVSFDSGDATLYSSEEVNDALAHHIRSTHIGRKHFEIELVEVSFARVANENPYTGVELLYWSPPPPKVDS